MIAEGKEGGTPAPQAPQSAGGDGETSLASFADAVSLMTARKQIRLAGDCETWLKPAQFRTGHVACAVKEGAPVDLLQRFGVFLEEETGLSWTIERADDGDETLKERAARIHSEKTTDAEAHPDVQAFLAAIPGAKVIDVREEHPVEDGIGADNVVELPKRKKRR